jgi:hypothetical protein
MEASRWKSNELLDELEMTKIVVGVLNRLKKPPATGGGHHSAALNR